MATREGYDVPDVRWPRRNPDTHYSYTIPSAAVSGTISEHGEVQSHPRLRGEDESEPKLAATENTSFDNAPLTVDRDLWTKHLSVVGLILAWGASIATLVTGILILISPNARVPAYLFSKLVVVGSTPFMWMKGTKYPAGHCVYKVSEPAMVAIPLLLQVAIALLSSCLDSIHSTTLRWAMWHEGRLHHNSNLRLFKSSKMNGPNKWPANIVSCIGSVLAYGGVSVMTFPVSVTAIVESADERGLKLNYDVDGLDDKNGIDFNGWGLAGLGVGLLLQTVVATWAILDSKYVGTWNSNPLATARACSILQGPTRPPLTAGSHSSAPIMAPTRPPPRQQRQNQPSLPQSPQPSILSLAPKTRILALSLWAVAAFTTTAALVVSIRASLPDSTRSSHNSPATSLRFVEMWAGHTSPWYVWQFFGLVEVGYNFNPYVYRREYIGLLIQCAVLMVPVFGLHVADQIVALARDESIWREMSTKGVDLDGSLILQGMRHPPTVLLFLAKVVVPWVFGFAISCNRNMYFAMLPSLTAAVLFIALAGFVEWLVRRRPEGKQPATYGDVRALMRLVDEWRYKRLFWGDKGEVEGAEMVRVAGTGGSRMADLRDGVKYLGLVGKPESVMHVERPGSRIEA